MDISKINQPSSEDSSQEPEEEEGSADEDEPHKKKAYEKNKEEEGSTVNKDTNEEPKQNGKLASVEIVNSHSATTSSGNDEIKKEPPKEILGIKYLL